MPDALRLLLAGALGAVGALAGAHMLTAPSAPPAPAGQPSAETSESDIALANLSLAVERLEAEVAVLRSRSSEVAVVGAPEPSADNGVTPPASAPRTRPEPLVASVAALTAAGVSEGDAQAMLARLDELALQRLQADFRVRSAQGDDATAARNDRRSIPRDRDAIRQEFGDAAYDRYLYSLNQSNRVAVSSVLRESAAQSVGLRSGDLLRSLDGAPLFSVRDLTQTIRGSDPERSYALVVERDGDTFETWVPGGPLGVRVSGERSAPEG